MNYPAASSGVFIGKSFSSQQDCGESDPKRLKKHKLNEEGYWFFKFFRVEV